jgi:putative sterol carrier protein
MYQCLQFFGGYGYMEEYKIARMFRDSRIGTIGGGTSEIMREIIGKMVIDEKQYKKNNSKSSPDLKNKENGTTKTTTNNKNPKIMSIETILSTIQKMAEGKSPLGSTLKLNFGDSQIVIDGTGDVNSVSSEDMEAACTVDISMGDFESMISGELNPMTAFMGGKMKVSGDMSIAMKLQNIL